MFRKNRGCLITSSIIIVVVTAVCVISGRITSDPLNYAGSVLRIPVPDGTTVIVDDYMEPSFPTGDGYSWMVLQISPEKINEFAASLEASSIWMPLPLPPELAENERYLQPTIMSGVEGAIPITTSTGYYLFRDRQKENGGPDTIKPFYERSSLNYTFGLFNDKDGKLYIWSLDT